MDNICVKRCADLESAELEAVEKDCLKNCKDMQHRFIKEYMALFDMATLNLKS